MQPPKRKMYFIIIMLIIVLKCTLMFESLQDVSLTLHDYNEANVSVLMTIFHN